MLFTKLGGSAWLAWCVFFNVSSGGQELRSSGGQELRRPEVQEAKNLPGGVQVVARSRSGGQGVARSGPGVQEAARGRPGAQDLGQEAARSLPAVGQELRRSSSRWRSPSRLRLR
jgi:hypothetical protein